jgi:hypothetical protein
MKEYPTIEKITRAGAPVYGFDKLDGSNCRASWDRKKGLWKFGRRHGLLDDSNPHLVKAEGLIRAKYETDLCRIFRDARWTEATAFFEFWGPGSFAGNHVAGEEQTVTLIDVSVHKKGILEPRDFVKLCQGIDHARVVFHGNFNAEVERQVREGTLPGVTFEGVVFKGPYVSPGRPLMFKVKSNAWLVKLKDYCKGDAALFERLA